MRPGTIADTQRGPNRGGMAGEYRLDAQVGYMLRQANQRHTTLFASAMIENLTPTQWAALAKLNESGPSPQNLLGRLTAMDAATIKGVIDRLTKRGFTRTKPDPDDKRRLLVTVTERGAALYERARPIAVHITEATLAPLSAREREQLMALLTKLV